MIEVISYFSSVAMINKAWFLTEIIPNSHTFSIGIPCTFNLIRSSSNTPCKVIRVGIYSTSNEVVLVLINFHCLLSLDTE
jgi:hypothetical protein